MDAHDKSRSPEQKRLDSIARPEDLTARSAFLLNRRAGHRAVRTEYATVSLFRPEHGLAGPALPEVLAAVCGHLHLCLLPTLGARDR